MVTKRKSKPSAQTVAQKAADALLKAEADARQVSTEKAAALATAKANALAVSKENAAELAADKERAAEVAVDVAVGVTTAAGETVKPEVPTVAEFVLLRVLRHGGLQGVFSHPDEIAVRAMHAQCVADDAKNGRVSDYKISERTIGGDKVSATEVTL